MKTALTLTAVLMFGMASQAAAEEARTTPPACPVRLHDEGKQPFVDRVHNYCEVRWSELVAARQTGGQTHDEFINACARKCAGDLAEKQAGSNLALYAGGAALLVGGAAAAASSGGGKPASP